MKRGANRGRGSSNRNPNPNPAFFTNFPQEYNPDFLRAQREFLLGNSGLPPSNLPSWNGYRAPHRSPQKAFTSYTPLRFSQPPPAPPRHNHRWSSEKGVNELSHRFGNLSVLSDQPEEHLLRFFREQHQKGQKFSAKQLVKILHWEKKIINHHLYDLGRKGLLQREGDKPPLWSILSGVHHPTQSSSRRYQEEGPGISSVQGPTASTTWRHQEEEPCISSSVQRPTLSPSSYNAKESSDSEEDYSTSHCTIKSQEIMADKREKVCEYLFKAPGSTVTSIKKNTGITKPSEINQILTTLDKEGAVFKLSSSNPVKWTLTDKKRERMLIKRRAAEIQKAENQKGGLENAIKLEESDEETVAPSENGQQMVSVTEEEEEEANATVGMPDEQPLTSDEPPQMSDEQPLTSDEPPRMSDEQPPTSDEPPRMPDEEPPTSDEPPLKRAKCMEFDDYENGKWALDEVPDVNKYPNKKAMQFYEPSKEATRLEKLLACLEKNPISGLLEFAQFCGELCELILLEQSGPSHDPRFKIQAVLGSRRFPVAEASNKKVARKDAAAMALRILVHEEQGGTEDEVLNQLAEAPAALQDDVPSVPQTPVQIGKNPISILMEHGQKSGSMCEFVMVSQEGPPHDPKFKYLVKIGSQTFPAVVANSKKNAKLLAAETAVKLLLGESALTVDKFEAGYNSGGSDHTTIPESLEDTGMGHASGVGDLIKYLNANPVSGLLEYSRAQGFAAEFMQVNQTGPPHDPKFVFQAKVGGRYFPAVSASNKKQAKAEAADAALRVLIGEAEKAINTGENMGELPVSRSTFHDKIAMLSHQKFNSLTARIQNSLLGRKILAAIIMKRDSQDVGTVVSIGTGNRCVKGEELSLRGETVNDCHAEIISRRGFIRYLYSELMTFNPNNLEKSIFEETKTDLLRVKPGVTFHLYISTAPCGDGALFDKSCSDQPCADGYERHQPLFENPKQGKLRTKVENGEGTIPVESSDIVPTWDGILHGERLRTMSCSDKILRWNVLGLQGAVLTHFMEPVYLSSVTLGYLFSKGHLTRAICCRMSREGSTFEQHLQIPYYVNHPDVGRVSVYDSTRQTGKTKESSVNWCLADEDVEVLDGTKGKVDGSKLDVSRLSKMHMFLLFQALSRNRLGNHKQFSSYNEVKEAATQYQTTKGQFFKALQELGYGSWISKPQEEKSFCAE